jgi:hypothetical protein
MPENFRYQGNTSWATIIRIVEYVVLNPETLVILRVTFRELQEMSGEYMESSIQKHFRYSSNTSWATRPGIV